MKYDIQSINSNITNIQGPYIEEDYSKFTLHPFNRVPAKGDVYRLKKAIENNFIPEPIKVNEFLQIMDGNHRFTVWQELSMPVLYMIYEGMRIEHVPVINDNHKKWSINTYLDYYVSLEKEKHPNNYHLQPYNLYKIFTERYPFNSSVVTYLLCDRTMDQSGMRIFKDGKLVIADWQRAVLRAKFIESMKELIPDVWNKRSFIISLIRCMDHSKWESKRWMEQLERLRSDMWICSNHEQYLDRIEKIYNKGRRNKVYFNRV